MKCIKESIGHGVSSDSRYFISVENSANTTTVCNNLHSSGCLRFWNLLLFKDAQNILGSIDSFYLYFIWVHLHVRSSSFFGSIFILEVPCSFGFNL